MQIVCGRQAPDTDPHEAPPVPTVGSARASQ
jgi:hypothetical protein